MQQCHNTRLEMWDGDMTAGNCFVQGGVHITTNIMTNEY